MDPLLKHVFVIPNSVTRWVADGVCSALDLPVNNCLYVLSRKYDMESSGIPSARLEMGYEDFPFTLRLQKVWAARERFRSWWGSTVPGKYHLYLPHRLMPSYQMMAGERRCLSISYLEEGLAAYYTNNEYAAMFARPVTWRDRVVSACGYFGKVRRRFDMYPDDRECYGLTRNSFPESRRANLVKAPRLLPQGSDDPLVIIAPKPRMGRLWREEQVADFEQALITFCRKRHIDEVGIKAHPGEHFAASLSARIGRKLDSAGISVKPVAQSSWLENHLMRPGSIVITMGSSIELYGPNFIGTMAYGGLLLSYSHEFCSAYVNSMPEAARSLVANQLECAAHSLGLDFSAAGPNGRHDAAICVEHPRETQVAASR